jgi:hypothetical protein
VNRKKERRRLLFFGDDRITRLVTFIFRPDHLSGVSLGGGLSYNMAHEDRIAVLFLTTAESIFRLCPVPCFFIYRPNCPF